MIEGDNPLAGTAFRNALRRILRPVVRTMIARGWLFPDVSEMLKELYVDECLTRFQLDGKKMTDSRISLLTGLQRKDIRALKSQLEHSPSERSPTSAGPLPRVLARWTSGSPFSDDEGAPRTLRRVGAGDPPSFETLMAEVSRDIHPRTVLDEMKRLDLVLHDEMEDLVTLTAPAFLPNRDDDAIVGYFGANLGDHAETAAYNLNAAPAPGPFFERAVHYNKLPPDALDQLDAMARDLQSDVLSKLNSEALSLQDRNAGQPDALGRFRCGAFIYRSPHSGSETHE